MPVLFVSITSYSRGSTVSLRFSGRIRNINQHQNWNTQLIYKLLTTIKNYILWLKVFLKEYITSPLCCSFGANRASWSAKTWTKCSVSPSAPTPCTLPWLSDEALCCQPRCPAWPGKEESAHTGYTGRSKSTSQPITTINTELFVRQSLIHLLFTCQPPGTIWWVQCIPRKTGKS